MINIQTWKSPVGELILGEFNDKICLVDWKYRKMRSQIDQRVKAYFNSEFQEQPSKLLTQTVNDLELYFKGELKKLDIPVTLAGTSFQKAVWTQLQRIPYGETCSYLQLSKIMNNEKAIRAVASANGANAISIIIPCHRVIGSRGELTGYAGGLSAKKSLLKLEGALVTSQMELF